MPQLHAPTLPWLLRLTVAALLWLLCAGSTWAQEEDLVRINMRDAEIRSVIQWIAEQTRRQIVIDPRVRGRVTVLADQPMTLDQAYEVFLATLEVYGFAATESGGVLRILPANQVRQSPRDVVEQFGDLRGGQQVVHVLQPENVSASELDRLIKPLLASTGHSAAYPASNSLLLADDGANVRRLVELVRHIDRSGSLAFEVIKVEHADAREVADLAQSLFRASGGQQGRELSIASDQRSNSLLLAGDAVARRQVADLVRRIDQPITGGGSTRVVYINYLKASELVPVLRGLSGSVQEDARDQALRSAAVSIEASDSANALILSGPPDLLERMEDVIERLDIRRAQVLVEAVIVEVSQDFLQRLGVEWSTSLGGDGLQATTRFGLVPAEAALGDASALLGSGLSLGFFRNGSLRALLRALATSTEANILSTPSVMTLDNQEAQIIVGSNIPIITGQATGAAADTENPFTTFRREDIGVKLRITPQINRGDAITLEILQEVETLAESVEEARDIITNKRSISTKVLVEDESILVLGGLISDEQQRIESRVPVLGSMPIVGGLFRSTTTRQVKRNLMVFIHPVIIDTAEDADRVSAGRYQQMRELRTRYTEGKFLRGEPLELPEFDTFGPRRAETD